MSPLKGLFQRFRAIRPSEDRDAPSDKAVDRWVIAGLGNPGEEYARSRHNLGFQVVERIARENRASFSRKKFRGSLAEIEIDGHAAILVKPHTYYNAVGECLAPLLAYYKTAPEHLIVVHDELDLELGRLKLKVGGGDAGNNGIKSITRSLGTPDYVRVRIGVGKPDHRDVGREHVLKSLSKSERETLDNVCARAAEAAIAIVREGIDRAMGRFNQQ
jgi:peptidyl-tRNA hydrolase, PTH1 family